MYIVAFFIGFLFWKSCKFWRRLRALDYIWKSGVGFTLFYFTNVFVEILGRKGSGTMIFIVSWCYGGLAMVIFILFWQGSYPPWWHHTGIIQRSHTVFTFSHSTWVSNMQRYMQSMQLYLRPCTDRNVFVHFPFFVSLVILMLAMPCAFNDLHVKELLSWWSLQTCASRAVTMSISMTTGYLGRCCAKFGLAVTRKNSIAAKQFLQDPRWISFACNWFYSGMQAECLGFPLTVVDQLFSHSPNFSQDRVAMLLCLSDQRLPGFPVGRLWNYWPTVLFCVVPSRLLERPAGKPAKSKWLTMLMQHQDDIEWSVGSRF